MFKSEADIVLSVTSATLTVMIRCVVMPCVQSLCMLWSHAYLSGRLLPINKLEMHRRLKQSPRVISFPSSEIRLQPAFNIIVLLFVQCFSLSCGMDSCIIGSLGQSWTCTIQSRVSLSWVQWLKFSLHDSHLRRYKTWINALLCAVKLLTDSEGGTNMKWCLLCPFSICIIVQ